MEATLIRSNFIYAFWNVGPAVPDTVSMRNYEKHGFTLWHEGPAFSLCCFYLIYQYISNSAFDEDVFLDVNHL